MKTHFKDMLQVLAAVLITGGMVASAAPTPTEPDTQQNKSQVVSAPAENTNVSAVEAPQTSAEPSQIAPAPEKVVTWQDNPNGCTEAQYIAKEPPFTCIDKPVVAERPASTPVSETGYTAGSCGDWLAQAGVTDTRNAMELIRRESGCNPHARNVSSGACGVAQELPCGKSGCKLGDGACQVKWMNGYVIARYGSWAGAVSFHDRNNWY